MTPCSINISKILTLALCLMTTSGAWADNFGLTTGTIRSTGAIVKTDQNLPPMVAQAHYFSGAGFADEINAYYQSGRVLTDQTYVATAAKRSIRNWLAGHCPARSKSCKGLVVFDIDETLLNNYDYYANETPPFTFNQQTWNTFSARCGQTAIQPTIELLHWLQQRGVKVVLLSGRSTGIRQETAQCLTQRGVTGDYRLILKSGQDAEPTAAAFKARVRRQLQAEGYTIVASVGDQISDMAHGAARRGFLLPNLMYFIP